MKKIQVAIDGPAGAGKSTVAQILARRLNYVYIDTGAMYRAVTWWALEQNVPVFEEQRLTQLAKDIDIDLRCEDDRTRVYLFGEDVTEKLRTPRVNKAVADVAQVRGVREAMLSLQQKMASRGGVVMDGRDISTNVLPNAEVKIFLTASIEERARRRWLEMQAKGCQVDLSALKEEIRLRDQKDSERDLAPLIQAPDAICIDTTGIPIEDIVETILKICKEKLGRVDDL